MVEKGYADPFGSDTNSIVSHSCKACSAAFRASGLPGKDEMRWRETPKMLSTSSFVSLLVFINFVSKLTLSKKPAMPNPNSFSITLSFYFDFLPRFFLKGLSGTRRNGFAGESGEGKALADDPGESKIEPARIANAVAIVIAEYLLIEVAK
jgi:hypothetical protein